MSEFGKTLEFGEIQLKNNETFTIGNAGGFAWNEEYDCWLSFDENTNLYVCDCDWSSHVGTGKTKEEAFENWRNLNK